MITAQQIKEYKIRDIAGLVEDHWQSVNFAAQPYLDAMHKLDSIEDNFGFDDGKTVILCFLSNARSFTGDVAKLVKAELKRRVGSKLTRKEKDLLELP